MSVKERPQRTMKSALASLASSNILRQAGWLAAAKIVQGAASIVATMVVGRHLGPAAFGLLSLASAIALFVGTTASLGLEQIATRELAAFRPGWRPPLLPVLQRMRGFGAVAGCIILLASSAIPASREYRISGLLAILCLLPLAQIGDLSEWRLIAAGRGRVVAIATALSSPIAAIARVACAIAGAGLVVFAWLLVSEWALRSLLLHLSLRERGMPAPEAETAFIESARRLLRDSMPLLLGGIAVFVYMRIDQFMIAAMLSPREVGLYSAVVTLAEVPLVLPVLLLRAALPVLSRQSETDKDKRDRTLVVLMRHTFYLHVGGAAFATIFAAPLVELLYGSAYAPAAQVLRIQAWGAPFVALGVISGAWIVLQPDTRYALWRTLLGAAINIALNLVLIPRFGIRGAACATVFAFAVTAFASDAFFPATRPLFRMKLRALGVPPPGPTA